MKTCTKCEQEKPLEEFHKHKGFKDGRQSRCKGCVKQYYENNKDHIREQKKQYQQNNKEKRKQYLENNKEHFKEYRKQYRENNREKMREYRKQYRENNREKMREYYENNRERRNTYQRQRRKNDPEFRLRHNISRAFHHFLKGNKEKPTSEYLKDCGYTRKELVKHLEDQFDQNMNWDNYGSYWHVDHIIPQSVFDYKSEQHLKWCWSLENLRPLGAIENILKADKITLEEVRNISFYEDVKCLL